MADMLYQPEGVVSFLFISCELRIKARVVEASKLCFETCPRQDVNQLPSPHCDLLTKVVEYGWSTSLLSS